jgi:hypothetical protein
MVPCYIYRLILFNQFYPGLSGDVDMNADGDIVFNSLLMDTSNDKELGQAIYKISVKK